MLLLLPACSCWTSNSSRRRFLGKNDSADLDLDSCRNELPEDEVNDSEGDDWGGVVGDTSVAETLPSGTGEGPFSLCCFLSMFGPVTSRKAKSSACVKIIAAWIDRTRS